MSQTGYFATGCFWGAERRFWQLDGVISTSVGYMGGNKPNPTYEEVCSGKTNHAEIVEVIFDSNIINYEVKKQYGTGFFQVTCPGNKVVLGCGNHPGNYIVKNITSHIILIRSCKILSIRFKVFIWVKFRVSIYVLIKGHYYC